VVGWVVRGEENASERLESPKTGPLHFFSTGFLMVRRPSRPISAELGLTAKCMRNTKWGVAKWKWDAGIYMRTSETGHTSSLAEDEQSVSGAPIVSSQDTRCKNC